MTCNLRTASLNRCTVGVQYQFNFDKKTMAQFGGQFMGRLKMILGSEGVEFDNDTVAQIIMRHAPDCDAC